ncbi:hypothetical protein CIW50_26785 [Tardiphaga sp. P9-11]|nr:hypothetical protein CIW50_26785 [Tardiphaga sp. P9-11]
MALAIQTHAQDWSDFATVSMTNPSTPKLTANRLCYTDGRDLLCDGAAGLLVTSGTIAITGILRHPVLASKVNYRSWRNWRWRGKYDTWPIPASRHATV